MARTIVETFLPWTFADEGTYRVSLDNFPAMVSIKYFPSQGRLADVTGLLATTRLHPDDPLGILNFSSIVIEFPFLLRDPSDGFDFDSSYHSSSFYSQLQELCLRYLNRLVNILRFCTKRYWIKSIPLDNLNVHSILEENDEDMGRGESSITIPTGRPFEYNIRAQSDVQAQIDELLNNEFQIPISENLFLEALNYYYRSDLAQAVITANTSLEVFVMDDMINRYIKTGKNRQQAIDLIDKLYKKKIRAKI
jgi:hypothetical protein